MLAEQKYTLAARESAFVAANATEVVMMAGNNGPSLKAKAGKFELTRWSNETEKNGKRVLYDTYSVRKSWKNSDGTWGEASISGLSGADLLVLSELLRVVYGREVVRDDA